MSFDPDAIARIHASAFNAHDMESLVNQYALHARVVRDGRLIGEGRRAVRKGIEDEYALGSYAQVRHLDGEPVLAECHGDPEHPEYDGVIRLHHVGDFLDEVRIDHDPRMLRRLEA